jgi:putative addiction module component (TIGR02574 family)
MSNSTQNVDYSHLNVNERILLVQEIWDSVFHEAEQLTISDPQKLELDRRWKEFRSGTMSASPWSEVKSRLQEG